MFTQTDKKFLLEENFKPYSFVDSQGILCTFYYRQGYFLKCLDEGYYAMYNRKMEFHGIINSDYKMQLFLAATGQHLYKN